MQIILASTSPYRRQQLKDFGLEFRSIAPKFDEESFKSSKLHPRKLCTLLAQKKAESLTSQHPNALILGADQLVNLEGKVLGKPKTREKALQMLKQMSGKTHELITCLCVCYQGKVYKATVVAKIKMRKLTRDEILRYIYRDNPLDSAGSYKFEMSGLSLVKKMTVPDPSSLTGLPLISLMQILLKIGEPIPFK
ncbi:MAG: septum formation protein Maf [Bdellovibrionales bacterium]|nr:septum formation protein Maf [Bdellovibrionales bacterium]